MKILPIIYRKICSLIQQFRNKKVNEQRLLTSLNCLSLKCPIFNKPVFIYVLCYYVII